MFQLPHPNQRNWFHLSAPCFVVTDLRKPYTKTEVGMGSVMYDIDFKTYIVDVQCRIKIPGIHFQGQKYSNENIQTITELMKQ